MKRFGTDIVALACVFGGGAVAVAATLAMVPGDAGPRPVCEVGSVMASPRVVVSSGREARAFVVTPNVRVHMDRDCMGEAQKEIRIHMERVRREVERARERAEEARRETQRVRIHVHRQQIEEAQAQMEAQLQLQLADLDPLRMEIDGLTLALESDLEPEIQARLQAKLEDLQERLEKDLQEKLEKRVGGVRR